MTIPEREEREKDRKVFKEIMAETLKFYEKH